MWLLWEVGIQSKLESLWQCCRSNWTVDGGLGSGDCSGHMACPRIGALRLPMSGSVKTAVSIHSCQEGGAAHTRSSPSRPCGWKVSRLKVRKAPEASIAQLASHVGTPPAELEAYDIGRQASRSCGRQLMTVCRGQRRQMRRRTTAKRWPWRSRA